jgi:hypothetical protein
MISEFEPDLCLSLGENCLGAFILKLFNLRNQSYLFDWASCERFDILLDILNNDLNHHIYNNITTNNVVNTLQNFAFSEGDRSKIIYIHHHSKDYQLRVAERFFDAINSNKKILFLYTYGRNNHNISNNDFDNLILIIKNKYPSLNFKLMILHYVGKGNEFKLVRNTETIIKYEYKTETPPPWSTEEIDKCEIFRDLFFKL